MVLRLCNQDTPESYSNSFTHGKVTQNQELEGLETGADAYVTKPFNADILQSPCPINS
jgi:DNA-binding response OmpR family regulator